jgi:hypothetical protein
VLQDAIMCLLHTFEILIDEDLPPNYANPFQPPHKAWNRQTNTYLIL